MKGDKKPSGLRVESNGAKRPNTETPRAELGQRENMANDAGNSTIEDLSEELLSEPGAAECDTHATEKCDAKVKPGTAATAVAIPAELQVAQARLADIDAELAKLGDPEKLRLETGKLYGELVEEFDRVKRDWQHQIGVVYSRICELSYSEAGKLKRIEELLAERAEVQSDIEESGARQSDSKPAAAIPKMAF